MDHVAAFLEHIAVERSLAPNTVATYARTLRTLPDPVAATREDVEAWWRSRTHLAIASRTNELSALRSFYKWCITWEHRTTDPTLRLIAPRIPPGQPRGISRADLTRLLAALPDDLRRAACLGAYAGLRVSEAASLMWPDVDLERNRMRVTGKGGKVRTVGLHAILIDSLLPDTGSNVVTGTAKIYPASALQQRVNRAIRAAGVDATFHQLRHRFGTMVVGSGANLLAVSRAMGHASPSTTAIYAATADTDLDLIAEAAVR